MHKVEEAAWGKKKLKLYFLSFNAIIELQFDMAVNSWRSLLLWGRMIINEERNEQTMQDQVATRALKKNKAGGRLREGAPVLDGVVKDLDGGRQPAVRAAGKSV